MSSRLSTAMSLKASVLLFVALSVAACGSQQENARTANTQTANQQAAATPAQTPAATAEQPAGETQKAKLNVNTATSQEFLAAIPGIGNRMVHEFEEYRPYRSIQQFRREIGKYVSQAQVAEYEKYVYVPINVNEADAATLQQIPGLDADEAQALIAGRPYADNEAFLSKLSGSVSESELAVARTYLSNR